MTTWDEAKRKSDAAGPASHRAGDLALLRRLLDDPDVREHERDAFEGMLRTLEASSGGFHDLTDRQRQWASAVAERVGAIGYENLVSTGQAPRGLREVVTPAVLDPARLPKKPPGRS